MEKNIIDLFIQGSCEYVILHAMRQEQNGKKPSQSYNEIRNPKKALAKAREDFCAKNGIANLESEIAETICSLVLSRKKERDKARINAFLRSHSAPSCTWSRSSGLTQGNLTIRI